MSRIIIGRPSRRKVSRLEGGREKRDGREGSGDGRAGEGRGERVRKGRVERRAWQEKERRGKEGSGESLVALVSTQPNTEHYVLGSNG